MGVAKGSKTAGGRSAAPECSRRWLYQSTYSRVAISTWSQDRHRPLGLISSVLNNPIVDSARALSYASATSRPTRRRRPRPGVR